MAVFAGFWGHHRVRVIVLIRIPLAMSMTFSVLNLSEDNQLDINNTQIPELFQDEDVGGLLQSQPELGEENHRLQRRWLIL